jgi:hypothetical protein
MYNEGIGNGRQTFLKWIKRAWSSLGSGLLTLINRGNSRTIALSDAALSFSEFMAYQNCIHSLIE